MSHPKKTIITQTTEEIESSGDVENDKTWQLFLRRFDEIRSHRVETEDAINAVFRFMGIEMCIEADVEKKKFR